MAQPLVLGSKRSAKVPAIMLFATDPDTPIKARTVMNPPMFRTNTAPMNSNAYIVRAVRNMGRLPYTSLSGFSIIGAMAMETRNTVLLSRYRVGETLKYAEP